MARRTAALALFILPWLQACEGVGVRADVGYMLMELAGDFGLAPSDGSLSAGQVGLSFDSGLDVDQSDSLYANLRIELGSWNFGISGFQYRTLGDTILSASFGDIPIGAAVKTNLEVWNLKGTITYDLIDFGFLTLSPGVAVDYFDTNLDVESLVVPGFESVDLNVPVPMPLLEAELKTGPVRTFATFGGMYANLDDVKGLWWDLDAKVSYAPFPLAEIFVGYRYIFADTDGRADGSDFDGEVRLNGLYFGGSIGF